MGIYTRIPAGAARRGRAGDRERASVRKRGGRGRSMQTERVGGRRVLSCAGRGHSLLRGSLGNRLRTGILSTVAAFTICLLTAAGASALTAQGSVKQVDVTGLPANAQAS